MKFKIGQIVKVIGEDSCLDDYRGKSATIVRNVEDHKWPWGIKVDGFSDFCVREDEIELFIPIGQQLLFGFMESKHDEV